MPLTAFHPAIADWFRGRFAGPSDVQCQAWPAIRSGRSTLIAAPTGSGKTLAAFLAAIDRLLQQGLNAPLPDETQILYVSPLKALSNDIQKNLELPLGEIRFALLEAGLPDVDIRVQTRTGDTSAAERAGMKRSPPHILVTTPESLFILLTSDSGRSMLATVHTVIVDEIHALAGNKRGAHLALSLERLTRLCTISPVRIGLSATQRPVELMANFLTGRAACTIIDIGHSRPRDLQIEVPGSPLEAVMAAEVWLEIYDRLQMLIEAHRTTLIFVNTRRLAERAAAALGERLGEAFVTAHHGSLAKEHRLAAEQRLKQGALKALVATASLELGIDIGDVDLVCQLGSPRTISCFLQRVGRSGHRLGAVPKGRLFPLSRDDLVECAAILAAVKQDELECIAVPDQPLDVLAQQIVAEVACREWREEELYLAYVLAWPYRKLTRERFGQIVKMLGEGYHTRRGRRGAYLHYDQVHGLMRARKGARLTAVMNAGAIPDQFDYDVILQPEGLFIGTLNEDFAFESLTGDVFQLGNSSYRILKIEHGRVYAEDARGLPPNIPFWFGEAPGRSDELSRMVSGLRCAMDVKLESGCDQAYRYLLETLSLSHAVADQLVQYLAAAKAALTLIPDQSRIVFERFFDETGDLHLVIHSAYGSRINRAWGLALRKRFCRRFNFELQAAAGEDAIVLSLGPTHSFPLLDPAHYLQSETVKDVLVQALLAALMFPVRWRWVANISLAVPRRRAGKKIPAYFQRSDAEDLIAVVFPDQLACQENIIGNRAIPDHPLVAQTLNDCLHELMDVSGLERLLKCIETGEIAIIAKELVSPSPLALEILNAKPYAFLDDAPAEERRTLAVQQRRFLTPENAADIGRLSPEAIEKVRREAWPEIRLADELHDALHVLGFLTEAEGLRMVSNCLSECRVESGLQLFEALQRNRRATVLPIGPGRRLWVAAERLQALQLLFPQAVLSPPIQAIDNHEADSKDLAVREIIRSRLEGLGPVTARQLAEPLMMDTGEVEQALHVLQNEGFVIQGTFTGRYGNDVEWCERGLLARIHRYTLKQLRSEIEAVAPADFMRFLFRWQGLQEPGEGMAVLYRRLLQLEGVALPAASWEADVLPNRVRAYQSGDLDQLCGNGKMAWLRLYPPAKLGESQKKPSIGKAMNITFVGRENLHHWQAYAPVPEARDLALSANAHAVYAALKTLGASFFAELLVETGLLKTYLETALAELAACGLVTADSFHGLRTLITPQNVLHRRSKRYAGYDPFAAAGRWSLIRSASGREPAGGRVHCEYFARVLLARYGVVFRKLVQQEDVLPSWRDLLYEFRRLEARGEIRGGRFVQAFSGDQFALPEALDMLREIRREPKSGQLLTICAADPLNLTGVITFGRRVPAVASQRILYRDGVPLAVNAGGSVHFFDEIDAAEATRFRTVLLTGRRRSPANML